MSNFSTSDILFKALDGQINIDSAQGIVECFVAAIGNKDSVGDVIVSGAFTESLKRRKPRVVWGHNWNDPIGKVLEIYEVPANDPRIPTKMRMAGVGGLYSKVQFNLATEKGREAFASVAFFGHEQEWSIGYKTLQATFDPTMQANVLREVELYEVSPVLHGANQLTATLSVKSDEGGEKCGPGGMHGPATMDIPRFNLIPVKPASISSHNEREDIFGEGEAAQLGDEARTALEMELASRSSSPIKVTSATENTVVFDRGMPDGTRVTYRLPYHMERHTGQYMFGKPEKVASQQIIPSQMPSMPMMVKPGYVTQSYGNPQQPISMMKSFDEQLDQAIGALSNAGEDATVKESELQKIQDAIDYLRNLAGKQQEKTALEYSVWCKPRHAYQVKSLLDPVLEYHRLEAHVDDYGVHITSGLNEESLQAVRSAHKNIAQYLDGGGGSKKDSGASSTKAAPQVRVKALGGKIGPKLGGGLRSAPEGMAFVDITGVTDADSDGIVFEGKQGLERPIIPRFIVPKDLARKLSAVVEGDAEAIERQRRAGNSNVSFDEKKLRGIIDDLGGDPNLLQNLSGDKNRGMRSRSGDEDIEAELDEQADRQFRMNREDSPSKKPKKTVRQLREEARARRDTQAALDDQADMQRDMAREDRGFRSQSGPWDDGPDYGEQPEQYDGFWTPDEEQLRDLDKRRGKKPQGETDQDSGMRSRRGGEDVDTTELVPEANLEGADLSDQDLQKIDLSYANLNGADLNRSTLSGASFQGANLSGANMAGAEAEESVFYRANLRNADMTGIYGRRADFANSDLRGADLSGADLIRADLRGADLTGANLQGANLKGAYLDGAIFKDANLDGAELDKGWEQSVGMRSRGMRGMLRDEFDFSNRKPDKKLRPAYGRSGPVPALKNMSDDELIKLLESYSEIAPRPWDRNRQSSFLFQDRPSLSSLVQELDSRGYDVYQSQGREAEYFGDYSAGDKGVYARKRGQGSSASGLERMLSEMSGAGGGETRVQDVIDSRLDDRRRGKSKGWKATVPDDYVPSDDALDTLSPQERRLLENFKPKPKWQREQEMLEHFRQQTRRDIDSGKMYDTWDWHPSFEEWDKDYKDRLRKYRAAQRKAYAHDIEKGNVKPEEKPVDEPMGMKDTIDWRLIADDEFIQPLRLGSQTRRYDGFRSAMKDVARRANAAEKNTRPSKEQRALDVLGPISQRGGQAFGLSDAEVQNFFDGGSRLDAGLQKIIKGELRRQGFTNDDIKDLMSGKYSDYVRGRINPPTKRPDLSPEEETWLSELNAITDAAERESLAVLADGLTEDEFADFVRTGKIPNGKESVIRRANEVYDSVSQDKDKQMAMGLRSRSAADIQSAIDANIKKQRDLEKDLDDGKIDLDEFRRRQTPLRNEFAELRSEQARQSPTSVVGQPELDATGRPRRGMVERDEKGKVKFDSEAFLAEKDRARRARMSELGFSEDEINTLLGKSSQPAGMRSRASSPIRKYADQQTRDNFLKGNNELISNRLGELVTERASVSDEIAQLDKNALEAGRELTDGQNSRWDELEGKLSEIDDEIGGIVDFLDYAEQEDIRRIAGKTSNDIARSTFKQMLDDDEISTEDYEKLIDDLIYPGFYDEEYWDSNGGIDAKQGIRSDLGNNSPYNPFEFSQYNSSDEINDAVSGLATELADEKVTDAVRRLRDGGLRSRSGGGKKKKKTSGPSRKLTPEQVRISQEQKLRSKKVPGKKKEGPSKHEWGFRSLNDYGISNNAVVEKLADLFSRDDNDLTDTERSVRNSLIGDGIKIDFSRVGDGDINADISLRNAKDASADEKLDSVIDSITSNEIASNYFNNRGFVVDDRYVDQPSYKREAGLRSRGGGPDSYWDRGGNYWYRTGAGHYKEWDEGYEGEDAATRNRIRRQNRPSNPPKATAPKPDDGDQLIQDASSIEGNDFAASIVKQYKERGRLTQNQWDSLRKVVSRNKKKSPSSSEAKQTENASDAVRPLSDDDKKAIIDAARKMDSDFARSVVSQYDARGRLSDKQWNALDKSTRKLRNSANNNGGMRSRRSYDDEGGSGGVREGVGESAYNSGSQYIDRLDGDNVKAEVIPAADIYGDDTPGYAVVGEFRTEDGSDYFYGSDEEIFDTVEDAMDFLQNIEDQGNDDVFYTDDNFRSLDRVRSAGQAGRRPLAGLRSRRSYDGEGGSGGVREGVAESEHFSGSMWIDQLKGDNVDADVIPLADIYGDDRPGYGVVGMYRIDDGFGGVEYFYGGDDEEFDSVEDAMDFLQNVEDQGNDGIFYDDPKFRSLDRVRSAGKPGRRPLEGMRSRAAVRKEDELEVGENFKPGEVVRRRDERGGPVAAPSAPPSGPPNGPNDDDNKNNPFKQRPNFDRAPDNDINDSNNPSKIADGMRSKAGTRLGESREIYPARRGEKSSAVDFVRYDAAREELVVQYKGGGVYTFGGISAEDADTIEESESLGKALNDAKRNSTYTVKPNGDVSGVQSDTADFLERDMRRVPMTEDDRRLYSSAIKLLRGNIDEDSDLDAISSQVSRMSDLGNEMWGNEDYAAANFLWEAAEKINKKVNSARGSGGFRSRASARHQRMEVNLSADEIGEIRDEIRNIMAKHSGNSLITYGLKKYDNLLEEWQGQKKSNPGRPLTVLSSEYDTIMSSYDELEGTDPDWSKAISADPLEMASVSKDGKFSSPNVQKQGSTFNGKRINNGAPEDITPRMQGELIDWGRRQPNFRIVQDLLKAHEKNNGQMTARQWSTLRNMFDRFAKENRGGNFRSRTGSGMRSEVGVTAPSTRKPGVGKGPRTAKEALPENYDSMSLDEKFDALLSAGKYDEQTNPNGIQVGEYNAAYRRLQDLEDEQERVAARREALAERMKRAAEAGPVTPRPRPEAEGSEGSAPKKQRTPEERAAIAKKQRQKRLSAIENAIAKMQDTTSGAVIDGDADDAHRELWDEAMDLILQEDDGDDADLTLSKLGSVIEALDNYVIGYEGQEMRPAERRSINNAVKLKNTLEELYDEIENDPTVPRGSTSRASTTVLGGEDDEVSPTPRFMTGEGLRSRSNLVNDYIGARRAAQRRPAAGMRSRSGAAQEGRAEIRWEATEFNKVEQALSREISEARNSGDRKTASALQNLMKIMERQKSGDVGGKRTNAGALYLTQAEMDDVMDALMHVVDRQASTGGSRINLFAQMLDKLAEAGMATFVQKTAKEVNSRFVEKTNEAGRTVRIPLNE